MLQTRRDVSPAQAIAADCHVAIAAEIKRFVASGTRQFLVTSTGPGEGKSTVVFNVGRALARQPELRVVLVDADQLRPSLHRLCETDAAGGLGELIANSYALDVREPLPAEFGLGDWVELLQVQRRTGRLEVAEGGRTLVLTFIRGSIASISDRDAGVERRLGSLLAGAGQLTEASRDQALRLAEQSGEPLGEIALRMGFVEAEPLQAALRSQFGERLQAMLSMRHPRCTYTEASERELGAAVTRDAAAAAGWAKQSGAMLMIRERLQQPYLTHQLAAALKDTDLPNLKLMTCGQSEVALLEGAGPAALRCVLEHLASMFDVVLVDSPPVALGSPAETISEMVAGTILVVQADRFEAVVVKRAKDRLEKRGAHLLGVILNQVDLQAPDQTFHYYYRYYPSTGDGNRHSHGRRHSRAPGATASDDQLPPKLRARSDDQAESESLGVRPSSGRLVTLLLLLGIVLGAFFALRYGPWSDRHATAAISESAPVAPGAVAIPEVAPPATDSVSPGASSAPVPAESALSEGAPAVPLAAPSAVVASARPVTASGKAAAPPRRASSRPEAEAFTISVGTFLDADRAALELNRLETVTPLPTRVQKFSDDGGESYRVVVGIFASRAAAVKAASDLMGTGQVREAMVLPATQAATN